MEDGDGSVRPGKGLLYYSDEWLSSTDKDPEVFKYHGTIQMHWSQWVDIYWEQSLERVIQSIGDW